MHRKKLMACRFLVGILLTVVPSEKTVVVKDSMIGEYITS